MPTPAPSRTVPVGLVQMPCTADAADNLARAIAGVRNAASRGARIVCLQELFRSAVFLPDRGPRAVCRGRADSRSEHGGARRRGQETRRGHRRVALRAAGRGPLSQHGGRVRRRRLVPGHVSQDAHPGRPAVLREILFHAGRPGFPASSTRRSAASASASAGTSGTRRPPDSPRSAGRRSCSIPPPSAGCRRKRRSTARPSRTPGKRCSAATRSPTACLWPRPTASATRARWRQRNRFLGRKLCGRPQRIVLARAGEGEEVLVVECDLALIDVARTHWPFLRDRRIDAYADLTQRYIDG